MMYGLKWARLATAAGLVLCCLSCGRQDIEEDVSPEAEGLLREQAEMIERIGRQREESAQEMIRRMQEPGETSNLP